MRSPQRVNGLISVYMVTTVLVGGGMVRRTMDIGFADEFPLTARISAGVPGI